MSVFSALYTLLIGPLELFFEVLYSLVNRVLDDPGLSIIFLSLAMNFLVLPLYKRADALQEEERVMDAKLKPWVTHIKKTFKGDERFMILQTYYRQNNYKTTDPLKGSVSLLLEIPFFMAAYNFLSALPLLQGASFGPIQNLGAPDAMLVIGGFAVNVLPILMTAINLISSAIYTKGAPLRSKIQLYVMAALFLVLLYDSPAGLVFYWTLNNLFSLVKNIFMKIPNPRKVFAWLASVTGVAALVYITVQRPVEAASSMAVLYALALMLQLPLILCYASGRRSRAEVVLTRKDRATFWVGCAFLAVLTGLFIPAGVIHVSPEEFINVTTQTGPMIYLLHSALTAAGFFLVWFGIFFLLASDGGKKWMSWGISAVSVIAVVNFMFFGRDYGNMSPGLVFDINPVYQGRLLNLAVVAAVAALVWVLWKKKQELLRFAILTACLAATVMSVVHIAQIRSTTETKTEQLQQMSGDLPSIPLSREGKNVIVLMMDRAVNSHVPYIMNEKPELREQFAGFTYYPNTISYGGYTNFGSPGLFGGYEYTPAEMNKRPDEPLADKHNEALKVMPDLFYNAGYETTVCDPPYAGYDWIPDLSIYDEYPGMHTYNTMGQFALKGDTAPAARADHRQNRNFFCYSIFKIVPVFAQPYVYDNGNYNEQVAQEAATSQTIESVSRATGLNPSFTEAYAVLQHLTDMTRIQDSGNTFLMLTNDTTHEPALLQEPDYVPQAVVDNTEYDAAHTDRFTLDGRTMKMETPYQVVHYQANMAAFLQLGEWFDYLREEGLYDNTRIIMVSDHGRSLSQFEDIELVTNFEDQYDDIMLYNPLLMVKDFGSTEFRVDDAFMTNADTAILATAGLIENAVNPFTGKPLDGGYKNGPQKVFLSHEWETPVNNGNTFLPGPWFAVEGPVFDLGSWTYLGVE